MVTTELIAAEEMIVNIEKDMADLVPEYLDCRRKDVTGIPDALARGDFKSVRVAGHNMAGTGAAYGFAAITAIGRKIEAAALAEDKDTINECVAALAEYVERVEIRYV